MKTKNLILAMIAITVSMTIFSVAIAKEKILATPLPVKNPFMFLAKGFAVNSLEDYKVLKMRVIKLPIPVTPCPKNNPTCVRPTLVGTLKGEIAVDDKIYKLVKIEIQEKSLTAYLSEKPEVTSNGETVGYISIQATDKPHVWIGKLSLGDKTYGVYLFAWQKKVPSVIVPLEQETIETV